MDTTERATEPGKKFDANKARIDLIDPNFIVLTAQVLAFGATKYGERNWEKGMSWSRPYAALQRHLLAWWQGEELDPETGISHLAHASCCLMMLTSFQTRGTGKDDRPDLPPLADLFIPFPTTEHNP